MASGFRPAVAVVTGIILGDILYLIFAIFGLTFVAQALGEFFIFVKICGGIYLVWLGLKIWLSKPRVQNLEQINKKKSKIENFISGLLITLSNPKVILFYCGFLPAFINLSALTLVDIVLVAGVVTIVLATVLTTYAFLASQARQLFSSMAAVKKLNRVAGGLMVVTGIAIASKS
ncbi:MAG: LysE family translocator [Desulfobacterales bacterium]|nr:LysE family translocator [Desulfobacterales bacterium]